ncbi:hypothetical protein [Arthrobacter sp. SD76]|uniref:hypothetical protein n=1 Tax=Arthrobacter sp. SD76 TaxID=3415007 RepID=UPI003C7683FD
MDAGTITAIVGAFTALSAGVWKLIDRQDKKRERREVKVEELLKTRVANLEAEKEAEKAAREAELAALRRYSSRVKAAAGKWREQLIAAGIDPVPAEWPEEEAQTHD